MSTAGPRRRSAKPSPRASRSSAIAATSGCEGSIVNLQVEYFIRQSGGDIIVAIANAGGALEKIGKP
jgi:hypothetical protein